MMRLQKRKGPRPVERVYIMSKALRNAQIEKMVAERIGDLGFGGKLEMDPIPNTFKRRNHYTKKADGTCVFTAFMWQLNDLSKEDLDAEIDRRIRAAVAYFGLKKAEKD